MSWDAYECPYCHHEFPDGYDEWEAKDFEDSTEVWCPNCDREIKVSRSWIAVYTAEEPEACAMCPGSDEHPCDDWECRINGCDYVKEY